MCKYYMGSYVCITECMINIVKNIYKERKIQTFCHILYKNK